MIRKENSKYNFGKKSDLGFSVENDGIDHINTHPKAKTELGKLLAHYAHTPFTHPYFGRFYSMEGFWYFACSDFQDTRLRYLSGGRARKVGKETPAPCKDYLTKEFKEDIVAANYQKIIQNEPIRDLMQASKLPFDLYYLQEPNSLHVTPKSADWLVEGLEDIRRALKEGVMPTAWLEAEKRYLKK